MILVDALYINVGGGKILLDYLIRTFNETEADVYYLLDERIKNNHESIKGNKFQYLKPNMLNRFFFYRSNKNRFQKILCFGNLPPNNRLPAEVYTYFHQPLFLSFDKELPLGQRIRLRLKMFLLSQLVANTDFWIVQSALVKEKLEQKYRIRNDANSILVIPFYPSVVHDKVQAIRKLIFLYVSSGDAHKNHKRLFDAFIRFYDVYKTAELHVTIEKKYTDLCNTIQVLQQKGYPIVNHGFLPQNELGALYQASQYLIFPSLAESFGLGIIEALENGCKIIGANRPYMYSVCIPSIDFDPESVEAISEAMRKAISEEVKPSQQLVFNNINNLTHLFT